MTLLPRSHGPQFFALSLATAALLLSPVRAAGADGKDGKDDAPVASRGAKATTDGEAPGQAACNVTEVEPGQLFVPRPGADKPVLAKTSLPCEYAAPSGQGVRVGYVSEGEPTQLSRVEDAASCGSEPAFYVGKKGRVHLCQMTCRALQGRPEVRVQIGSRSCR
jgi:hypothetical protein